MKSTQNAKVYGCYACLIKKECLFKIEFSNYERKTKRTGIGIVHKENKLSNKMKIMANAILNINHSRQVVYYINKYQ